MQNLDSIGSNISEGVTGGATGIKKPNVDQEKGGEYINFSHRLQILVKLMIDGKEHEM
jgi:hypothetical protein